MDYERAHGMEQSCHFRCRRHVLYYEIVFVLCARWEPYWRDSEGQAKKQEKHTTRNTMLLCLFFFPPKNVHTPASHSHTIKHSSDIRSLNPQPPPSPPQRSLGALPRPARQHGVSLAVHPDRHLAVAAVVEAPAPRYVRDMGGCKYNTPYTQSCRPSSNRPQTLKQGTPRTYRVQGMFPSARSRSQRTFCLMHSMQLCRLRPARAGPAGSRSEPPPVDRDGNGGIALGFHPGRSQ